MNKKLIPSMQNISILLLVFFLCSLPYTLRAYVASDYNWRPPFTMANEIPSITIILDSSDAMHRMAYANVTEPNTNISNVYEKYGANFNPSPETDYLGYFTSNASYRYDTVNNYFVEDNSSGQFDGDFMNWATMHRLDVARIILTGGYYNSNSSCFEIIRTNYIKNVNKDLVRAISAPQATVFAKTGYNGTIIAQQGNSTDLYIYNATNHPNEAKTPVALAGPFKLRIYKKNANPTGILDQYADKARFALARYYVIDENHDGIHDAESNSHKGAKFLVHMDQYGTNTTNMIKYEINKIWPSAVAAPMAEALFTATGYIMQTSSNDPTAGGPKYELDAFEVSSTADPYYFSSYGNAVSCTQQNIIFITPGESSFGDSIPIGDTKTVSKLDRYPYDYNIVNNDKYYLLDTAKWMHTNDLRGEPISAKDLDGTQNVNLYIVQSFGIPESKQLLQDAAMFGGFIDGKNNTDDTPVTYAGKKTITTSFQYNEYSNDGDTIPDNYFAADDGGTGRELREAITSAFEAATRRVSAGTAAAVTSQTRSGDGAVYQALFFPPTNSTDANPIAPPWSGQVHAMLVDSQGRIREDTVPTGNTTGNGRLDSNDRIISFTGELIYRYNADGSNEEILNSIQDINFLWSSTPNLNNIPEGSITSQRVYNATTSQRYILTFADANDDGVVNSNAVPSEIQHFTSSDSDCILDSKYFCNYLTLFESESRTLGTPAEDHFSSSSDMLDAAKRQVDFIRGKSLPTNATSAGTKDIARSRGLNATIQNWRLGDVVYSSPTIVGAPSENYHNIYRDSTYKDFYDKYKHRRQVLYVGANDGMLHAFNGGFYNASISGFQLQRNNLDSPYPLGMELWAYIPYNLLPHLRWLMNPNYGGELHVPYMDLKPRVFDARIFVKSSDGLSQNPDIYPNGWGTLLVAGMRFGGASIKVDTSSKKDGTQTRTMSSAYVIMDITDPESPPKILGEIRMPKQGFTTCYPTVMPMSTPNVTNGISNENQWLLVFGSGPASSSGEAQAFPVDYRKPAISKQSGQVYIVDLMSLTRDTKSIKALGSDGNFDDNEYSAFITTEADSFIGDPIAVDLDIGSNPSSKSFKTDIVYFGTVAGGETDANGTMRRITTNNTLTGASWSNSILFDAKLPITSAPSAAVDETNRLWIYFGAGRFYNRSDIDQQKHMSFFGIKEPIDNSTTPHSYSWNTVDAFDIYNSSTITLESICDTDYTKLCTQAIDTHDGNRTMSWDDMVTEIGLKKGGWRMDFQTKWERVLGQPAVLGGVVLFTTYSPDTDICIPEGLSALYGLYYKTGTAYYDPILGVLGDTIRTSAGLGTGLAITPSLHVGDKGATAYIQTSSGAIETIELNTPISVQSGTLFWRKNTD